MRVAIFVDGAYLEKILKNEFANPALPQIDYSKLAAELSKGKDILRTYYYNCLPYQSSPPTNEEKERFSGRQKFYNRLETLPRFTVKLGKLLYRGFDKVNNKPLFDQKGVDVLLSIDMVSLAARNQIYEAVLIAGDSDFIPAVNAVKDLGITVTLYHSQNPKNYHRELWLTCDERVPITKELLDKIKL